MMVANREIDFFINSKFLASKWDTCAAEVIINEAGGIMSDLYGKEIDYKSKSSKLDKGFVASNKYLHPKILKQISESLKDKSN